MTSEIRTDSAAAPVAGRTELSHRVVLDDLSDPRIERIDRSRVLHTGTIDIEYSVGPLHVPRRLVVVQIGGRYEAYDLGQAARPAVQMILLDRLNSLES